MWSLLLGAASVGVGYLIVAVTRTDSLTLWDYGTFDSLSSLARLVVLCVVLFASFIAVGVVLATLFGRRSDEIGRLYFADLLGAGLACAVVVWLLGSIGPPATIMLAGLIMAGAGLRIALRRRSRVAPVGAVMAVLLAVAVVAPSVLPYQRTDESKADLARLRPTRRDWSAVFRVDAVAAVPNALTLIHDGLLGSAIYRFDGNPRSLTRFDSDPRSFPFEAAGTEPDNVLIIGAAGGNEVLASLYFDAGHIDAVELNPVTYRFVTQKFADYDGHFTDNPKVNYVNDEGRGTSPAATASTASSGIRRPTATRRPTPRPRGRTSCPRATCTRAKRSPTASTTCTAVGSLRPSSASSTTTPGRTARPVTSPPRARRSPSAAIPIPPATSSSSRRRPKERRHSRRCS